MQLSDFNFDLPDELIARYPLETRSASRLLHLSADGRYQDHHFTDILDLFEEGDLLVLNDTKVMKARLKGCQYYNCTHEHEPKCAIKAAVETGEISIERYSNYINIMHGDELKIERWEDK